MEHFDDSSVAYLENEDFDSKGNLLINTNGKPVCIMLQGSFCGYCTQMKPEYKKFATTLSDKVFMATVHIDGNESEQKLNKRLSTFLPDYEGVPIVLGYNSDGKYVKTHDGKRTAEALEVFSREL